MPDNPTKKIYLSYAHAGKGKQVTESLDKAFQGRGVLIQCDVRDVQYKESFREFMVQLSTSDYVIAVIDKPYLESHNCMYELIEVYKNERFRKRVFPILLPDAELFNAVKRIGYIKYWENKTKELEEAMRSVSLANLQGVREELDLYIEIRQTFAFITDILTDMNTYKLESHQVEDFKTVFETIQGKINKTGAFPTQSASMPSIALKAIATLKKNVQTNISKNRINEAITHLNTFANTYQSDLIPETTAIQREYDEIQRQKMRGTLTYNEISREMNKLVDRLFGILSLL